MVSFFFPLIAVAIMALGVAGWFHSHDGKIEAAQKAKDDKLLIACQTNEKTATDANLTLQASIAPIRKERDDQSAEVLHWKTEADKSDEAKRMYQKKFQVQAEWIQDQEKNAHAKGLRPANPSQTCQQVLDEMNADAKEWLPKREAQMMREILGLPAVAPSPAPALRIGE